MAKIEKGAERSIDVKRKGNDKPVRKRTGFISVFIPIAPDRPLLHPAKRE